MRVISGRHFQPDVLLMNDFYQQTISFLALLSRLYVVLITTKANSNRMTLLTRLECGGFKEKPKGCLVEKTATEHLSICKWRHRILSPSHLVLLRHVRRCRRKALWGRRTFSAAEGSIAPPFLSRGFWHSEGHTEDHWSPEPAATQVLVPSGPARWQIRVTNLWNLFVFLLGSF